VKIQLANFKDLPEVLKLQKLAFQSEAKMLNDYSISPLTQTLEELEYEFAHCIILIVIEESCNKIIGSIRAFENLDRVFVGKLMVHPQYQNKGLGSRLLKAIESYFSDKIFELRTTSKSLKNIYLYTKVGYSEFKREKEENNLTFIYFQKFPYYYYD
jgi:GNAT superfamily N-acetyltransferase